MYLNGMQSPAREDRAGWIAKVGPCRHRLAYFVMHKDVGLAGLLRPECCSRSSGTVLIVIYT